MLLTYCTTEIIFTRINTGFFLMLWSSTKNSIQRGRVSVARHPQFETLRKYLLIRQVYQPRGASLRIVGATVIELGSLRVGVPGQLLHRKHVHAALQ